MIDGTLKLRSRAATPVTEYIDVGEGRCAIDTALSLPDTQCCSAVILLGQSGFSRSSLSVPLSSCRCITCGDLNWPDGIAVWWCPGLDDSTVTLHDLALPPQLRLRGVECSPELHGEPFFSTRRELGSFPIMHCLLSKKHLADAAPARGTAGRKHDLGERGLPTC